ncbi:MAG TPA: hypothetical protein VMB48_14405, partial [Steroidobacteraceae bacterium]|nr:hypothetical protein [Steroidobacteraceae bacterium]
MNIPRTCTRSLAPGVLALLGVALLLAPLPPDGTAVAAAAAAHAQPPGVSRAAPSSVAPAAAAPAAATPAAAAASAPAAGTASPDAAGTPGASPAPATAAGISDNDDDDRDDRDEVNIGGDSVLSRGENADEVVAVFGSATSEGTVSQDVVAVFGDARMTGTAGGSVVAVLGDVYVDGEVDQDVVSVLGHIELGPHARINGQVVNVFGSLHRDPAAVISGGVHRVFPGILHDGFAPGLRAWLHEGVLFGRPLALGSGLSWAWYTALAFLALYLLVAVLFRDAVDHCVATLSLHPGPAVMTALLAMLITPLAMFLLFATLIGIPAIPILACALFAAGILGKVVALAWLGRRVAGLAHAVPAHPALAVLLGGIVTLAAYLVPLLGF